jgi:hypothetical protein
MYYDKYIKYKSKYLNKLYGGADSNTNSLKTFIDNIYTNDMKTYLQQKLNLNEQTKELFNIIYADGMKEYLEGNTITLKQINKNLPNLEKFVKIIYNDDINKSLNEIATTNTLPESQNQPKFKIAIDIIYRENIKEYLLDIILKHTKQQEEYMYPILKSLPSDDVNSRDYNKDICTFIQIYLLEDISDEIKAPIVSNESYEDIISKYMTNTSINDTQKQKFLSLLYMYFVIVIIGVGSSKGSGKGSSNYNDFKEIFNDYLVKTYNKYKLLITKLQNELLSDNSITSGYSTRRSGEFYTYVLNNNDMDRINFNKYLDYRYLITEDNIEFKKKFINTLYDQFLSKLE